MLSGQRSRQLRICTAWCGLRWRTSDRSTPSITGDFGWFCPHRLGRNKVGKRWVRLFPKRAYRKSTAVWAFQGLLLRFFFAGKKVEVRPVRARELSAV